MKMAYKSLFAMLSINLSIYLLSSIGVGPSGGPWSAMNLTQTEESLNATEIVDAWEWGGGTMLGDVVSALRFFWNLFRATIWGLPDMLNAMSVPSPLVWVIRILWSAYWVMFVVWFMGGRDLEGA